MFLYREIEKLCNKIKRDIITTINNYDTPIGYNPEEEYGNKIIFKNCIYTKEYELSINIIIIWIDTEEIDYRIEHLHTTLFAPRIDQFYLHGRDRTYTPKQIFKMMYVDQHIKGVYEVLLVLVVINITVFDNYSSFKLEDDNIHYASCIEEKCEYIFIYEDLLSLKSKYKYPWYKHYPKSELKEITNQDLINVYTKYNDIVESLEEQQKSIQPTLLTSSTLYESSDIGYYYESANNDNYIGYFITSTQFTYIEQGMSNYNLYQYKFVKTKSEDEQSFMIKSIDDFDDTLSGIDFPENSIDGCIGFIPLKYKNYCYYW